MRMSTGGSPSAISDVAMGGGIGGRSTRSSIGNLLNAQRVRLDDIITSDIKRTTNQLDSISGGISTRRGAAGSTTKMNVINSAIDRSLDTSTMSRGNKKAFSDYFDRLKKSGFSDSDIGKLTNTLRMESIESLENKTYVDRGTRSARRSDMSTLRRELSGVSYNYDMSRSTERAIRYTGAKSSYGDAFKIGDEVTSQMASKLKDAAKDYTNIANVRSTSALSSITDSNALSRFASDLNVSVADISSGNISNEQLQLLRQNGKWLRESSENARGLLDGFRSNRFQGVTAIEQRTRQILPNVDRIMSAASARDNVSRLGSYDFSTLSSPKTADKMVRLLNRNREALSSISVDVPANLRNSLGGAKQLNLMEAINTPQFQSYRRGGLGTLATMSPANQQRALAGNTALSALENDPNLFKQVIGQMDTGGTRLGALKNINKLSTLIRRSSTMRNIGRLGGGLMSFIDPLFIGMQSHSIAKEMGLSGSQAMGAGVGAAGALGGGILGARRLMGAGAFTKSLGKVGGLGGGLAVLTTGLDLINSKLKSDRAIDEQRQSYMADMGSINFEGVDRTALTKAGGSVINNEKLRNQQAKKSMMDNALLKTLLIGGGATAAVMSGGTLIPMLGLAAAGMGAS